MTRTGIIPRGIEMKTFYKTNAAAFKNAAGYWDKSMLRERGHIEKLEPNIIWADVFKKIEPMVKADKAAGIPRYRSIPYHMAYEMARIKQALKANETHVGTFRIPVATGRGKKVA